MPQHTDTGLCLVDVDNVMCRFETKWIRSIHFNAGNITLRFTEARGDIQAFGAELQVVREWVQKNIEGQAPAGHTWQVLTMSIRNG